MFVEKENPSSFFCFSFGATLSFTFINALVYVDIDQGIEIQTSLISNEAFLNENNINLTKILKMMSFKGKNNMLKSWSTSFS